MNKNTKILIGFLILIVIGLVGVLAYVLGGKSATIQNSSTVQYTPAPTDYQTPDALPSASPIPKTNETVLAGGVLSFPKYSLVIPEGWQSQREQGENSDKLTLTKTGFTITISEGAFGGSGCTYPGDAPQEMAQAFTSFVEITNPNGFVFRRSSTGTGSGWTVCQKGSEGSFGGPTNFGHISITAPSSPDTAIVTEIDSILASIRKQ